MLRWEFSAAVRTICTRMGSSPIQGAGPVTLLYRWDVPWVSRDAAGVRQVKAPDARSAEHDLETNPSEYGLPHEHVIVGRARLLHRYEATLDGCIH